MDNVGSALPGTDVSDMSVDNTVDSGEFGVVARTLLVDIAP